RNLVSAAGLVPVLELAEQTGLSKLIGEHVDLPSTRVKSGAVNPQPVREALQRMQTEGWVDLRPALGAFVHVPTEDEADQLLAARTLLETESARLAAEHATPEQLEHLWELHRSGEAALEA